MDIHYETLREKKIFIVGRPGTGKTTFAKKLEAILKTKVYHLDRFFWKPDWKGRDRYERMEILDKLVHTREAWIIEGSYVISSEPALEAADIIIFLKMNRFLCLWRIITRYRKGCNIPRRDIAPGCSEKLTFGRLWKVLIHPYVDALDIMHLQNKHPSKSILQFRLTKTLDDFLSQLKREQETLDKVKAQV